MEVGYCVVGGLTLVVQAVFGGEDALQEGARLGTGAGRVHGQKRLRRHLPTIALLLFTGIHCNTQQHKHNYTHLAKTPRQTLSATGGLWSRPSPHHGETTLEGQKPHGSHVPGTDLGHGSTIVRSDPMFVPSPHICFETV